MNKRPLVSLCMPTNGIIDWVFPVLDSIYNQGADIDSFEVVITDNGDNREFKKRIIEFEKNHTNLIYAETQSPLFMNEIESYKRANGLLIKFVNHRTILLPGTLQRLIDFAGSNSVEKPIIYYSNGMLNLERRSYEYSSFDMFVGGLSYWSSWSTGMTIWKEDFDQLPTDMSGYNELFPHTTVLFHERNRGKYIIDNSKIFRELTLGANKKGKYDFFYAFGIEYPWILCTLLRDGCITTNTFKAVIKMNKKYLSSMFYLYCLRKTECSYDITNVENIFGVFYKKSEVYFYAIIYKLKSFFHLNH